MSSNLTDVVFLENAFVSLSGALAREEPKCGVMAEWLRRQTRNLVGSALVGSNPADVVLLFVDGRKGRTTLGWRFGLALCPSG